MLRFLAWWSTASTLFLVSAFLDNFGLLPHEVGYGQVQAVSYSAALSLVAAPILLVLILVMAPPLYASRRVRGRILSVVRRRWAGSPRALRVIIGVLIYALAVASTWQLALAVIERTIAVGERRARAVHLFQDPGSFDTDLAYYFSAVTGMNLAYGEATWDVPDGSSSVRHTSAVTLFGVGAGMAVFFDHCSEGVTRVPTERLVFRSDREQTFPVDPAFGQPAQMTYCEARGEPPLNPEED